MPHASSPGSGHAFDPAEPIAVVGMAMRFPGGSTDSKRFWDMLEHGRSAHGPVPKSRFNIDGYYHPDGARTGSVNIKGSYFLEEDPFYFDAPFFAMTQSEANGTDGQQRLMLEVAYETLENAGIPMHSVIGSQTGVYVGCFTKDFESLGGRDPFGGPFYAATGNGQSMLSNRVSWFFDLRGPSFTIDTACSSSLYAVHLACQSLRTGETKAALVGGTNLIYDVAYMRDMVTMTFFSPDGVCHSFDHRANGYARGDGIGGVLLKTVKQALADGDTIRAVIRGTGLNQDGKTPGITMPSPQAQADLIRSTYAAAGLSMEKTAYFEAHGTGTAIGDPYELSALGATFGTVRTSENPIYVGSVKTNLGHLEGCAGLAGLIKTVLVVEKGQIPPLAGFEKANPRLKLDEWHVALPEKLVDWPSDGVRRASVNSFGYGGANAHVIVDDAQHFLQEHTLGALQRTPTYSSDSDEGSGFSFAPTPAGDEIDPFDDDTPTPEHKLFVFSSADQAGLQRIASTYSTFLEEEMASFDWPPFTSDLAYTLAFRRSLLDHRSFVVANSGSDLIHQLHDGLQKRRRTAKSNNTFFVFSGQGAQWPSMGKELVTYQVYRDNLHRAQSTLLELGAPWSLVEELFFDKEHSRIDSPDLSQPLCTALQLALVDLLKTWDVLPKSVVGHSSGEIAAAYAAGHISHEDAMKVAYLRGIYSADVNRRQPNVRGAMMAAGLSPEACQPYMDQIRPHSVVVACINAPSSVTLSGDEDAIVELETLLNQDGIFARRLRVSTAYHSHHMQLIARDYLESMGTIAAPEGPPSGVTMFSSVTAAPISAGDINSEYWVKNLLGTVRFSEAVQALVTQPLNAKSRRKVFVPYSAMIECGPAEALKGPLNQILAATDEKLVASIPYISMLSRGQNAESTAMKAAGRLWAQGIRVDLSEVNFPGNAPANHKTLVNLPPYPWNHSKLYYHESSWGKKYRYLEKPRTDLLGLRLENQNPDEPRWHNWIKLAEQPWLSDHRVQQRILYPGAAMVTMAFEAARELIDPTRSLKAIQADKIGFKRGLMIPSGDDVAETAIHLRPSKKQRDNVQSWEFTVFSKADEEAWQENCTGAVSLIYITDQDQADADAVEWQADLDLLYGISKRATRTLAPETFYKLFDRKMNLQYGTLHQNVTRCIAGIGEGLGTVTIPDTQAIMPARFEYPHLIHPSTLDSVFHMQALGYLHSLSGDESLIPISIESIYVAADVPTAPGSELLGYSKGTQSTSGDSIGDIVLSDDQWSSPKVVVRGFLSRDMSVTAPQSIGSDTRTKKCTNIEWVDFEPATTTESNPDSEDGGALASTDISIPSEITEVLLLHNAEASDDALTLVGNLADRLGQLQISVTTVVYTDLQNDSMSGLAGKVIISLVEAEESIIAKWDAEGFARFKSLALQVEALLWITRGGDAVSDRDLQFHISTGLLRTVRVERPQLKLAHLDIDPKTSLAASQTASKVLDVLKASILNDATAAEQEFAEVNGKLIVPRLQTQESFHAELGRSRQGSATEQRLDSLQRPLKGTATADGKAINWSDDPKFATELGVDEVDVQVSTVALERLRPSKELITPTDATGVITSAGANVLDFTIGDRVVVCGLYGLAARTRTHKSFVRRIPDFMSVSMVAALPSAFCAAEAMIIRSSNLQPGEDILICASPGTFQQTLVSFATHIGANIFVTCETPANRRLLGDCFGIPEDHILGSVHSEATWKTLKSIAGAGGIDVVINTVGAATEQSMASLADFGRFVVSDALQLAQMSEALARNITLATVDIEHMRTFAPTRLAETFSRGWARAKDGYLGHSLPGRRFRIADIEKVGDYLRGEKCSGGALLTLSPDDVLSVFPPDAKKLELDPQATYVLSGGLGGIGRSIAELLFAAGARNISFVSRSGAATSEAKRLLESLQERGCNARAYACDITDAAAVETFAQQSLERGEVIRGVIQCAMVLRDSMFDNMTFEQWTQSLAPKVQGSWHLHQYLPSNMDFFIMLSSMAGIIGNPGQANYSAAGTYQDALSRHRRANGMASTTIDLGIVSDVGYIAENAQEFERLAYLENLFISERDLHLILSAVMLGQTRDGQEVPSQLVTGVGKELLSGGSIGTSMSSDLKYVYLQDARANGANSPDASEDEEIKANLKAADTFSSASKLVEDVLATNLGRALTMEKDDIDLEKPIHAYGVDSLVAVEVRNMIFRKLKADISVFDIMSNMSLVQLAAKIVSKSKLVKAEIAAEGWQD